MSAASSTTEITAIAKRAGTADEIIVDSVTSEFLRLDFSAQIRGHVARSIENILAIGNILTTAKETLAHGEFEKMVCQDLGWTPQTARKFMAISRHPVLSNRAHVRDLPPSWGTLALLARVEPDALERAIASGRIGPQTDRPHASRLLHEILRTERRKSEPVSDGAPMPTLSREQLVERAWDRARQRTSDALADLELMVARLRKLTPPQTLEDLKKWRSLLRKAGFNASLAAQDLNSAQWRIENPTPDDDETGGIFVRRAQPGEESHPFLTPDELHNILLPLQRSMPWSALGFETGRSFGRCSFQMDARDNPDLLEPTKWTLGSVSPGPEWKVWAVEWCLPGNRVAERPRLFWFPSQYDLPIGVGVRGAT